MCIRKELKTTGKLPVLLTFASALAFVVQVGAVADYSQANKEASPSGWRISSKAFQEGQAIPRPYTADGQDASPPLEWGAAPARTRSLALICDDPDAPAGTWVHWLIYELPAGERALAENLSKDAELKNGIKQGTNSFNKIGYNGPSPPPGKPHRYFFKLYALDSRLNLKGGIKKEQLEAAMKGHVLAQTQLMGTYGR